MINLYPKIIIKEDEESKRLAEQKSRELEKEKARRIAEAVDRFDLRAAAAAARVPVHESMEKRFQKRR